MNTRGIAGCLTMLLAQASWAGTWHGDLTYTNSDGGLPKTPITNVDNNDTGWQISAGYDVNKHFAIEFGYVDYGQQSVQLNPAVFAASSFQVSTGSGNFNPFLTNLPPGLTTLPSPPASGIVRIFAPSSDIVTETTGLRFAGIGKLPLLTGLDLDFQAGALVPRYKTTQQVLVIDSSTGGASAGDIRLVNQSETSNEPELFVGLGLHWRVNQTMGVKLFWEKLNDLGNEDTLEQDIDTYNLALRYQF